MKVAGLLLLVLALSWAPRPPTRGPGDTYLYFCRSEDAVAASTMADMGPSVAGDPDPAANSSISSTLSSTRTLTLRSSARSHMSLPDVGRPGSAQATLTRVHCPQCTKFLLAKSLPGHLKKVHKM